MSSTAKNILGFLPDVSAVLLMERASLPLALTPCVRQVVTTRLSAWPERQPGRGHQEKVQQWCMVAQIHDELLFEIEVGALPAAARLIRQCMEEAAPLSVPLRVKMSVGPSWGGLLPYTAA